MDADGADQSKSEEDATAEETRATTTHSRTGRSEPDATGFVWCETGESASGASPVEGGFEWGFTVDDRAETAQEQPAEHAASTDEDDDGDDDDDDSDGLSLDPTLVTTARVAGIDDEVVSRLAAFRQHAEKRSARFRRRRKSE